MISINEVQAEFVQALQSLSRDAEFGVVVFSEGYAVWNYHPQRATRTNKVAAITWLHTVPVGFEACIGPAMLDLINIANLSTKKKKQIFLFSDREPFCEGASTADESLTEITAANWQKIPIHTVYKFPVVLEEEDKGYDFMEMLASENKGTFKVKW